jgi:hypothetical protein
MNPQFVTSGNAYPPLDQDRFCLRWGFYSEPANVTEVTWLVCIPFVTC